MAPTQSLVEDLGLSYGFPDKWDMSAQYEPYAPTTPIVRYPDRSGGPNDLY
eukprot:CAMPEP_0184295536 /NCGR_PEP_ID=MMETSP1049-20130417/6383_1 /TAXON_ID=77928 /ORGANISM="Proteomonas sulcata, Strain CCMP704" /LENGTH=50 /DNA_ID=CAMNT_0026604113 /DNA_START=628 /DNA_END=780 /DNA_ORIENTATION=-